MPKSKRGGRRPNSGLRAEDGLDLRDAVKLLIRLPPSYYARLQDWAEFHGYRTIAAALRYMIDINCRKRPSHPPVEAFIPRRKDADG